MLNWVELNDFHCLVYIASFMHFTNFKNAMIVPLYAKNCVVSAIGFLGWCSWSGKTYSFEMVFCEEFISYYCGSWETQNKKQCVVRTYFDHLLLL